MPRAQTTRALDEPGEVPAERPSATRRFASASVKSALRRRTAEFVALLLVGSALALLVVLGSYDPADPSLSTATSRAPGNLGGHAGAVVADVLLQGMGFAVALPILCLMTWAWRLATHRGLAPFALRLACLLAALPLLAATLTRLPLPDGLPAPAGPGGAAGPALANGLLALLTPWMGTTGDIAAPLALAAAAAGFGFVALGLTGGEWRRAGRIAGSAAAIAATGAGQATMGAARRVGERVPPGMMARAATAPFRAAAGLFRRRRQPETSLAEVLRRAEEAAEAAPASPLPPGAVIRRREPRFEPEESAPAPYAPPEPAPAPIRPKPAPRVAERSAPPKADPTARQASLPLPDGTWRTPPLMLLAAAPARRAVGPSEEALQGNARMLETVLEDYGVRGRINEIRPGPVVTLYELEPAPGTKSARVIGLADDIARSMSVTAVRIATVPGRNVIGIEMPNARRETVLLSELLGAEDWAKHSGKLNLALGKDIGGQPMIADLARMPHLLIAGTTGSGKSVAINTMILSLLYRLSPDECRFIMIDPKMLELSVYDRIPHLLAPVVTEPPKAIGALKWTVREMERRYRSMSQLGVRNIAGYNEKVTAARAKGEVLTRRVQVGFDPDTNRPLFEDQPLTLEPLPMIVVIIDEVADLMMVAGKEIEAAVQRLAQMARAAGIHVIMATQRPSVDVITGTIKANFPTRISFQVTSKIDSRTILGEMGAEQLLGQGDMLYMMGGGRITRVHGPFVSDQEVEHVVAFLREQGEPHYVDEVTEIDEDTAEGLASGVLGGNTDAESSLYDQAVALVTREGKASTSFVQRHLNIGYNRAAKLIEQMEKQGVVGPANHVGKREVLAPGPRD
jgi:S-DNA-T family DNA segregation ATPase FtsK/SpoIIIE